MIREKIRKNLDKIIKIASLLCLIALLFAAFFSINYARKRSESGVKPKEIYFDGIHTHFNTGFGRDSVWNDLSGEISVYDAQYVQNGKPVTFDYRVSMVKEDFNDQFNVKTASYERPDIYEVMHVNVAADIPDGPHVRHFLNTMFFLRSNSLVLHKMTASAQDPEGNVFRTYFNTKSMIKVSYNSYHDGEGIGEKVLDKDVLFEDQFLYTFRSLRFEDGLKFHANVLATQATTSVGKLEVYPSDIEVSRAPQVLGRDAWKVRVQMDTTRVNEYFFDQAYPHILLQQKTWDGRTLELKSTTRVKPAQ
jgi:hypothetical protein